MPRVSRHEGEGLDPAVQAAHISSSGQIGAARLTRNGTIIAGAIALIGVLATLYFTRAPDKSPAITPGVIQAGIRSTCSSGSICLWPEPGFAGTVWVWSPGSGQDSHIPENLRNHVGSFDAQTTGCFVDSESREARPVALKDHSRKYNEKFGSKMDMIQERC